MVKSRLMNQPEDYEKFGINPDKLEAWEDGRRETADEVGHGEVWYFDCSFDDKTTLVFGFRPKSHEQDNVAGDSPNVSINYTDESGKTFIDYRRYDVKDTQMSKDACNLKFGPSTLISPKAWETYDVHIEPEADCEVTLDGKTSTRHESALDLHFEAITKPFRPGTGYISFGEHNEYYCTFICITRMKVTGRMTINGISKEVTGSAYYNHQWQNTNVMTLFHHWLWGRQNIGSYNVLIYDMVAAECFDFTHIPLFTVDDEQGNRIFENTTDDGVTVNVSDSYVQAGTGKRYPKEIAYTFEKPGIKVQYEIYNPKEITVIDFYGQQSDAGKQMFDKLHVRPAYTRYLADSRLTIIRDGKSETTSGPILYEFNNTGLENPNAHLF
ncbi:MAG: lipocalin-like domain-containing protein [Peptococcaceae bacterium]